MKLDKLKISECKQAFFAIKQIQDFKKVEYFEKGTLCKAIEALQELEHLCDY